MGQFDDLEITIEKHRIKGKLMKVKRVYITQTFQEPVDPKEYFRLGLKAKKILKYVNSEKRFGWIIWYI